MIARITRPTGLDTNEITAETPFTTEVTVRTTAMTVLTAATTPMMTAMIFAMALVTVCRPVRQMQSHLKNVKRMLMMMMQ